MPAAQVNRAGDRLRRWLHAFGAWALPARCPLCAAGIAEGEGLCAGCRADLVGNEPCCARCAEPLVRAEPVCGRCLRRPPGYDRAFAGFRYAWPLDGLVTRFKFGGDLAAGRTLARLLAERVRAADLPRPDLLVPVPLHDARLRERGHDQALELARDLGRALQVPVAADLLRRIRATRAQTELDAPGRRRNVRGAFALDLRACARRGSGLSLALVDDVMTTGSTLSACGATLRRAGYGPVQAWVVARAPGRR
jgi:ComF family protein